MTDPSLDWICRDMQRLQREGAISRLPSEAEWNRIWSAANTWAEKRHLSPDETEGESIERFVLEQAPGILSADARELMEIDNEPFLPIPPVIAQQQQRRKPHSKRIWGTVILCASLSLLALFYRGRQAGKQREEEFVRNSGRINAFEAKRELRQKAEARAKYAEDKEQAIRNRSFWVGMSVSDMQRSLGKPDSHTVTDGIGGRLELWYYGGTIITIYDGKIARYTQSR